MLIVDISASIWNKLTTRQKNSSHILQYKQTHDAHDILMHIGRFLSNFQSIQANFRQFSLIVFVEYNT